ncbi:hypothetical protein L7F22_046559 [Adiantum nelumboides]|nr:hypothetical protein [Adiantum nelumboides]
MGNPALQGEVQQQLHAYGILPPIPQERGPERFQGETSKRGLSTEKGVENPYQELKQLLEGKPSSKKKGHAQHERSPSREREESESSDESMEDVAPRRRIAQRSPTPTKRKRSPHSPHRRESKREEKNSKKKKERKRSPSSPSLSPSSSSDEGSGYSSQERQRRGHRRSYAAWKRSSKLKKFKEGGKNISFLTYDGTFGATDKPYALKTIERGKVPRGKLSEADNSIRKTIGWSDPVDSLSVYAYIAKSEANAFMVEEKWKRDEETAGSSKRATRAISKKEEGTPPKPTPEVNMEDAPKDKKQGMEEIQKSPSQISPQGGVFSLDNILDSPKKAKYIPPRLKVIKTFDLSTHHSISWFLDTYDFDGVYQEDLHLYVKQEGQKYGDMGSIVNAKEDLNDMATPCITITTVRNGETTKATDISLHLEGWAVADTIGSIQGKENSFGKLGMSIVDFSKLREEGYSYAHLIKGIWKAKAILCPGKKTTGSKKAKTTGSKKEETPSVKKAKLAKQEKAIIISEGREIVKSAIAIMAGEHATSSQPFSTQRISSLKNLAPQVEGPTEQRSATKKSQKSNEASKRKRSRTLEVIDTEQPQKRQKKDVLSTSLQLAVVNPNTSMVVEANENKALASIETKKTYYPFGFESNFSIDVMKCFPAPSHYVYRMLNKDWVKILTHDLIKNTKFQEILAIVMPIDEKLQCPLQTFTKDQISSATYWIISGQHSIVAAKHLQKSNLDKVSNQLRQQFRYKRCKILLDCPPKLSREISKDANISVAKSMQEEPFLDQLLQARSQWIANDRPRSTHTGIIGTKVDCETKDYMDGDEHVEINNAFPNTLMVIEKLVLHPMPQLDPKGVHDLTKHLETTSSPNKEEELKELEDETKSKEINKVLEIGSCILEEVLDAGKSKQTAEVADIENKNDGDEMILEGDMQAEEQVEMNLMLVPM